MSRTVFCMLADMILFTFTGDTAGCHMHAVLCGGNNRASYFNAVIRMCQFVFGDFVHFVHERILEGLGYKIVEDFKTILLKPLFKLRGFYISWIFYGLSWKFLQNKGVIALYPPSWKTLSWRLKFLSQSCDNFEIYFFSKIVTPLRLYHTITYRILRFEHVWRNLGDRGTSYLYFAKKNKTIHKKIAKCKLLEVWSIWTRFRWYDVWNPNSLSRLTSRCFPP